MGLIMQEGKFVSRDEVARTDTPSSTTTWHPVPHIDVIEAVTEVIRAHNWNIEGEKFGLASDGRKMFGVMEISRSSSITSMCGTGRQVAVEQGVSVLATSSLLTNFPSCIIKPMVQPAFLCAALHRSP